MRTSSLRFRSRHLLSLELSRKNTVTCQILDFLNCYTLTTFSLGRNDLVRHYYWAPKVLSSLSLSKKCLVLTTYTFRGGKRVDLAPQSRLVHAIFPIFPYRNSGHTTSKSSSYAGPSFYAWCVCSAHCSDQGHNHQVQAFAPFISLWFEPMSFLWTSICESRASVSITPSRATFGT